MEPAEGRRGGKYASYSLFVLFVFSSIDLSKLLADCVPDSLSLPGTVARTPPYGVQHEAAVKKMKQAALDAEREFTAKEAALRAKESHLEDALKARWGRKPGATRAYA